MRKIRLIQGMGDFSATPPTGASDADLYQMANDFIAQEGVIDLAGGDALVAELDTPDLGVQVAKGTLYVLNSTWEDDSFEPKFYQVVADEIEELETSSNSSGETRIDLVAQKIDKVTSPNDEATNVSPLVVIEGTPGEGAPTLPDDHLLLATLTLPDGYAAITDSMITDNRQQVYLDTKIPQTTPTWIGVSSFSNGWVNYGAGYYDASYVKDDAGYVHLRGVIKSGSGGTVAFNLPSGYRPVNAVAFPALSSTGNIGASTALAAIQINSNGDITITGPSLLTGFVSLGEVTFYPG